MDYAAADQRQHRPDVFDLFIVDREIGPIEDDEIGEAHPSGGWVRFGDETEGFGPIPDQEAAEPTAGWYSDMVISTEAP